MAVRLVMALCAPNPREAARSGLWIVCQEACDCLDDMRCSRLVDETSCWRCRWLCCIGCLLMRSCPGAMVDSCRVWMATYCHCP